MDEFGFDAATKLNLRVARSLFKSQMKILKKELKLEVINNIEDFKANG